MNKGNSDGFTPIELILAILVAFAIIGVGWYLHSKYPKSKNTIPSISSSSPKTPTQVGNQAQADFKPLATKLVGEGATFICDNGDNGEGVDNQTPWYSVDYTVPSNFVSKLQQIASEFNFTTDTSYPPPTAQDMTYIYKKAGQSLQAQFIQSGSDTPSECGGDPSNYAKPLNISANGSAMIITLMDTGN